MIYNSSNITCGENDNPNCVLFLSFGVFVTALSLLGVLGNICSLVILSKPQMRSSISCALQLVAIFDIILLMCSVLLLGLPALAINVRSLSFVEKMIIPTFPIMYTVANISHTGSTWGTTLVTVERYIVICHPLKARSLCTYKRARVLNLFLGLFSVCINLPRYWECEVHHRENGNMTLEAIVTLELKTDKNLELINELIYIFFVFFAPCITFTVLNGFALRTLQSANKNRRNISHGFERENKLFLIILLIGGFTVLSNIIRFVFLMWENINGRNTLLEKISDLLVVCNSSVNFLIYSVLGKKFRRSLMDCSGGSRRNLYQVRTWQDQHLGSKSRRHHTIVTFQR